ncbi:MAG: hypothetical protein KDC38_10435 [Planctomycetes bacterium]|nr:hypothetical protein [Planctomycetota bacterium]
MRELRATEERGEIEPIEDLLSRLDGSLEDDLRAYVRARLYLALCGVARFDQDNHLAEYGDLPETWIGEGLAAIDPILEAGRGESEHYRVRADLVAMRVKSIFSGARWASAIHAARDEAQRLDPDNPWIALSRGKEALFTPVGQDLDQAERELRRAARLDPTWSEPYIYLARLEHERGNLDRERGHLETCRALNPDRRIVRVILGRLGVR